MIGVRPELPLKQRIKRGMGVYINGYQHHLRALHSLNREGGFVQWRPFLVSAPFCHATACKTYFTM